MDFALSTFDKNETERIMRTSIRNSDIFLLNSFCETTLLPFTINEDIYNNIENVFEGIESSLAYDNPVLFVKGGASDYILDEDYDLIKKNFPIAQFKTIKNASHWVHADAPDELCQSFSEFLNKSCDFNL